METKLFTNEVDAVVQSEWKKIIQIIQDANVKVLSLKFEIKLKDDILTRFGLNNYFRFVAEFNPGESKMLYLYKDMVLEPINYYLRPEDYHEVSLLEILHQCIVQDTYQPDIRFLERGEKEYKPEV